MTATREALLDRARLLFNEHGLEQIGVRDLARDLGLSPGNVSYHFAKKEDLVGALMAELAERNTRTIAALTGAPTLTDLLDRYRLTFSAQYDYRFLPRAIVHVVEAYPHLGERYLAVDVERRRGLSVALMSMVGRELRRGTDDASIARIVGTCTLTARFWLGEMHLSFRSLPPDVVIDHYLALIAHSLWSAATPKGRRSLEPHLERTLIAESLGGLPSDLGR